MAELIAKPVALLAGLVDDTAGVKPDLLPEDPPPAPHPARKKTTAVDKARLKAAILRRRDESRQLNEEWEAAEREGLQRLR